MKTLLLSAAAALTLAGPVLAATPVERAQAIFAQSHESGDGARTIVNAPAGDALDIAREVFAASYESGDGARYDAGEPINVAVSTSNSDIVDFAKDKLDTNLRGDN